MKYRISTSVAGLMRKLSLSEALDTVEAAGFRCLDFPLSIFSRPADSPLKQADWKKWTHELKGHLDSRGFQVTQAHASWEQAVPEDFQTVPPYEVYARTIEACRILGCGKLVFHPPLYFFPTRDQKTREKINRWNAAWFQELIPFLEEFDVTAEIENMFDYKRIVGPGDPPFLYSRGEDMLWLLRTIGSDQFGLCLDTGHAHISAQDPAQMIRDYGKNLGVLHLNDNFGLIKNIFEDLHQLPGHGNLEWPPIFEALHDTDFQWHLNLEPVGALPNLPFEVRVIQLKSGIETIKAFARAAGLEIEEE